MNPSFFKQEAKFAVSGNRFLLLKPYLILWIASYIINILFMILAGAEVGFDTLLNYDSQTALTLLENSFMSKISPIVSILLTTPLNYGMILYYNQFEQKQNMDLQTVFTPFHYTLKIFVISLFTGLLISIGGVFFLIPGIVLACTFAIIPYVYTKHPELGVMDMISHAWKMMQGHKMEYLLLELSFLGWYILGMFTCGIAILWVLPYHQLTMIKYFNSIYDSYQQIPVYTVYS